VAPKDCKHPRDARSVDTGELQRTLEDLFARHISYLTRRHLLYSSTFAIEELEVVFRNSASNLPLIFKNVSPDAVLEAAVGVKPAALYDPRREIEVYRSILSPLDAGTPKFYGAVVDPEMARYWLFLERVPGCELRQVGDFETWLEVAQWLARFHASPVCAPARAQAVVPHLLDCDAEFCQTWLDRANAFTGGRLDSLIDRYERISGVLLALPRTLIHGEFYASNILVPPQPGFRVCPVDWEMAAVGPGLLDVAALAAGTWNREQRLRIAEAHYSCLPAPLRVPDFQVAFDCCQLQIALQWLGWADQWTPSNAHAHDWLAEALELMAGESLKALLG
jgi:hypothetical protein